MKLRTENYNNGVLLSYNEIDDINGTIKWTDGRTTRNATAEEIKRYQDFNSSQDRNLFMSDIDDDMPMVSRSDRVPSESMVMRANSGIYNATRNRAWVNGIRRNDTYVYYSKSVTSGGTITFFITDDGTATGNAVFTNVYSDTITITPYGNAAAYQIVTPVVSADKKRITAQVTQTSAALLNVLQFTTAANNVDCRLLVLGD